MKRPALLWPLCAACSLILCLLSGAAPAWGQGTWMSAFRRLDADPNKAYDVTDECGPWLIYAAAFAGDTAQQEAHQLVLELRRDFKLPAYIHKQHYDYTNEVDGLGLDMYGERQKMRYQLPVAYDEVAVVVGNFQSVEDPNLQKVLKTLKFARPACLTLDGTKPSSLRYAGLREIHKKMTGNEEKMRKGPMAKAFAIRNPILPQEYFTPGGIDKLVLQMNDGVQFSLLDCQAAHTVKVATFGGNVISDPREMEKVQRGESEMKYTLAEAAEKAHRLTMALRARNIEAYEFHDRHQSIVTVGSFQSLGTPQHDGTTEINPAVYKIMQAYGPNKKPIMEDGKELTQLMPNTLEGIPFDVQPMPIDVPRRSVAADYAR